MEFNGNSALEAVTSDVKVNGSVENDAPLVDAVSNGRGGYTSDDDDDEVFEAALDKLPTGARTSTTEDEDDDEDDDDDVGEVFGSGRRGEGEVVEEDVSGDAIVEDVRVDVVAPGVVVVGEVEKENGEGLSLENGFEKISEEDAVEVGGVADGDGLVLKTEREVGDGVGDVEVFETALDKLPIGTNMTEEDDDEGEVFGLGKGVEVGGAEDEGVVLGDGVKFTSSGDAIVEDVSIDVVVPGVVVVGEVEEGVSVVENGEGLPLENGFEEISKDSFGAVEVGGEPKEISRVEDGQDEGVGGSVDVVADGDRDGLVVKSEREVEVVGGGDAEAASEKEKVEMGVRDEVREADDTLVKDSIAVSDAAIGRDVDVDGDEKGASAEGDVYANGGENDGSARVKVDANGGGKGVNAEAVVNVDGGEKDVSAVAEDNVDTVTAVTQIENNDDDNGSLEDGEIEGLDTDEEMEEIVFESPEAAQQFLEELERGSGFGAESSHDNSQRIDGQIATDSDEEVDTDEEGDEKELYDSAALAALLKAATGVGSDDGTITLTSQDGSRLFSVERPAGLGSTLRSLRPAAASQHRPNLFTSSAMTSGGASVNNLSDEEREKLEKLQQIRVKFLRLIHRLGHSPEEATTSQVLYRLALAAGRQANQQSSLEAARRMALQQEQDGKDDLDFSLNILLLGKTGVGKSATINSIFGEQKSPIHAFEPVTDSVKEITGVVDGMKIRVLDIPGLKSPAAEQGKNRKVLFAVKRMAKKFPPDIILYVDRLDIQTRDLNDMPLLRTITDVLGSSIWRSAIVTLTHAASAPPDGPSGSPLSYEVFVAQRSHVVQQSVGQACGDLRLMNPTLMNPVALVENHPSCRKNREGQKVLPNGQAWRSQLLLLCCSVKILSEASSLSKPQEPLDHKKLFGFRARSPPLPYLLSWLLQSRTHPRLPTDQGGDSIDSDVDLADLSDSDDLEERDEYDGLPTFKPLRKNQLARLTGEQKKAYLEEYDYRVKLLQKKQWKQELRRIREMKKRGKVAGGDTGDVEDDDADGGAPASVAVPLPDMVLPPSFDSDNPGYRYRFLEPTSQFLARPVLDSHGWDHDCGYDGVNVEQSLAVINQFPATIAVQVTKDKKEFNLHLDSSISAKHGDTGSSMAGFDIQNVGKQLAYVVRGETKFKNFKRNKTGAGVSVTFLGKNVATGVKVEDQILLGKRLTLVGSTGTVRSQGDAAYGANVEVRLTDVDYPVEQDQSSLGLSLVKWRGDLALGANLQSQFSIGRGSKVAVRAGLNNKMSGQLTVKTSSSEQLQLALVGLLPIALSIYKTLRPGAPDKYSMY